VETLGLGNVKLLRRAHLGEGDLLRTVGHRRVYLRTAERDNARFGRSSVFPAVLQQKLAFAILKRATAFTQITCTCLCVGAASTCSIQ
jgi:hypothetical protein